MSTNSDRTLVVALASAVVLTALALAMCFISGQRWHMYRPEWNADSNRRPNLAMLAPDRVERNA